MIKKMKIKRLLLCLVMVSCTIALSAANKRKTIYMFGLATSFNDSTVYFTEVQQVDSAYIDSKTKFLYSRNSYSYQLRDYLEQTGFPNATCVTSFAFTRKEAEKKYLTLRKRYLEGAKFNIKYLKLSDFKYSAIAPTEQYTNENGR
jgi:hypothetical protein